MIRVEKGLIPLLCLALAVALLFGRGFIPHGGESPPFLTMETLADGVITLHYHERPPYYMTGPLGVYGLCVDPAKLAFNRANIPFRWEKTPAKRQLDIIKENRSKDCIIGWFKNPDREKFAKYSHVIYQDKPTIALARADNYNIISNGPLEETLLNSDLVLRKFTDIPKGNNRYLLFSKQVKPQN